MKKPPLQLHLLAHPESTHARALAERLVGQFVDPPATGGLRVPVYLRPETEDEGPPPLDGSGGLDLDASDHTLVAILADSRMNRRAAAGGTGEAWAAFLETLAAQAAPRDSAHCLVPFALDKAAFNLMGKRHMIKAQGPDEESQLADISLHIAIRAIMLLEHGRVLEADPQQRAPQVRLFLSHAKADLDQSEAKDDPVRHVESSLSELPIDHWIDAKWIEPGEDFSAAIRAGIRDCSITLAFYTDAFGSRPFCREEVLESKAAGAHILVVDALEDGEVRSFPYLGNVPTIHWSGADSALAARRVVDRAIREALRFKHNRALVEREADEGEIALAGPPEAVTLSNECEDLTQPKTFLYPDPPLGHEEVRVLKRLRPNASFLTPLSKAARSVQPGAEHLVALSTAESQDIGRYGLCARHLGILSDEIYLYLLMAGFRIAYGGTLSADFVSPKGNFTLRLMELVTAYSELAQRLDTGPLRGIVNYAPWPLRLTYTDSERDLFENGPLAYVECPAPDLPFDEDELFPLEDGKRYLKPDTAERRYAWARGLREMRQREISDCTALLAIGGKLRGYSGVVPGVAEEALLALRARKPLLLIGAFGGAARAVIDQIVDGDRTEFTTDYCQSTIAHYDEAISLFDDHGADYDAPEPMGAEFAKAGSKGPAKALNNGLTDDENEELFYSADMPRLIELIIRGLASAD